jgi:hypothetical protein
VSRYKLSRSQKTVKMQDLYCVQVSVSGCKMLNEFIWPAEQGMMINDQKKKNVRAHKLLALFARLAYTSPGKKCDKQLTHIVRVSGSHYCIKQYLNSDEQLPRDPEFEQNMDMQSHKILYIQCIFLHLVRVNYYTFQLQIFLWIES